MGIENRFCRRWEIVGEKVNWEGEGGENGYCNLYTCIKIELGNLLKSFKQGVEDEGELW
jgi:hypothetical protein